MKLHFYINQQKASVSEAASFLMLGDFLRGNLHLSGTKLVCRDGDCGACTVILVDRDQEGELRYQAANSCILPLFLLDGKNVITVEGLGNGRVAHPVQKAVSSHFGAQCGYCTPGIVCALATKTQNLKSKGNQFTEKNTKNCLTGNLCRCTGYEAIIESALIIDPSKVEDLSKKCSPEFLKSVRETRSVRLEVQTPNLADPDKNQMKRFYAPNTLIEACEVKARWPEMRLIGGATDLGVLINREKLHASQFLSLARIDELSQVWDRGDEVEIGAQVSLTELERVADKFWPELGRSLRVFASPQIKNLATLGGNIVNASPIGDTPPILLVLDADLVLASVRGERRISLSEFFKSYKKTALSSDEILKSVILPKLQESDEKIRFYKVSNRRDLDISTVSFAGFIRIKEGKISHSRIAMGGVGPCVLRLDGAEADLLGQDYCEATFYSVSSKMDQWIKPLSDLRSSGDYRMKVSQNLVMRFYEETL